MNTVRRSIHTKQRIESVSTNLHNDIYICYSLILYLVISFLHIIHCMFVVARHCFNCARLAACHVPLVKVLLCFLGVVAVGGEEELSTIMTLMPQKTCTRHFVLAVYHFELLFAFCYLLCNGLFFSS